MPLLLLPLVLIPWNLEFLVATVVVLLFAACIR